MDTLPATSTGAGTAEARIATPNEARYVLAELAGAGSYMISMGHRVEGPLDAARLMAAFEGVITRHAALRTRFTLRDRTVWAQTDDDPHFVYHHRRIDDSSQDAFRDWAVPLVFENVHPSEPGSLVRLLVAEASDHWRFTVAMHHAVSDGFSRGVVNRELLKLYAGESLAETAHYHDFQQAGKTTDSVADFIAAFPAPTRLAPDGCPDTAVDSRGVFVERDAAWLGKELKAGSKAMGATRFGVLGAAYALTLSAFAGRQAFTSFFQTEGRKTVGAPNSVVGPFSNTQPMDLSHDPDQTFAETAKTISERVAESAGLETSDLTDDLIAAGKAPSVSLNMFPPAPRIRAGDLNIGPREFLDRRTEYDLNLVWSEDSGIMRARLFYDSGHISQARAAAFLDTQLRVLKSALAEPDQTCGAVQRTVQLERPLTLPAEAGHAPVDGQIHDAFFRQAIAQPDAPALITSQDRWSYAELSERALRVTAAAAKAGIASGEPVAIIAQRGPEMVAAMLGLSAYGASFAVIDATYPSGRIAALMQALGARFFVTAGVSDAPSITEMERLIPAKGPAPIPEPAPSREIAYHLFTSGTTGQPRRISHPDTTLMRFVEWQTDTFAGPRRTVMLAGLSHDPIMRDVFVPLTSGGAVVIPSPDEMQNPAALCALISDTKANTLNVTPATGQLISLGISDGAGFDALTAVFWGGDRLEPTRAKAWRGLAPNATQFNLYGATETPQAALLHKITDDDLASARIPLGHPLPWTGVRIENDGQPVGAGVVGEIVIDLADPVFGVNSAKEVPANTAQRTHYTGDLGYIMPETGVSFVGRRDAQVKINSVRIELSEIVVHAERLDHVKQATAIVTPDQTLALFLVAGSDTVTDNAVRLALEGVLPPAVVPPRIFLLDRIPLTPNGKINEDALAQIAAQGQAYSNSLNEPIATPAEREIAHVLSTYSGLPVESRQVSLADLGTDSLSRIEIRLALEALGVNLPDRWEWQSIATLATHHRSPGEDKANIGGLFVAKRLESFIVLRCIAITLIVAHHAELIDLAGVSVGLIVLAGYGFGRLQLPAILEDGRTGRVWATIAKLLVPLIPAAAFVFAAHTVLGNDPHVSALLFYENLSPFIEEFVLKREDPHLHVVWLWFLHVYLQMFLLIALILTIKQVRQVAAIDPWRAVLTFFLISVIVAVATNYALSSALDVELYVVVDEMFRSPTTLLPILTVGALLALSDTPKRYSVAAAMVVGYFTLQTFGPVKEENIIWPVVLFIILAFPFIRLPAALASIVLSISLHSLIIYLSHRVIMVGSTKLLGVAPTPFWMVVLSLCGGVLLGLAIRPALAKLGIDRLSRMRIST